MSNIPAIFLRGKAGQSEALNGTQEMKRKLINQCRVCNHREHAAIDLALARCVSIPAIARRYEVSTDSLHRHVNRKHLPDQLRAALIAGPSLEGVDLDRLKETESQSLLMHLIGIRNRLQANMDEAERHGDVNGVNRTADKLIRVLEVIGNLLGELGGSTTTINNVLVMPAYVEMRVALVKALGPFPDARKAVAKVLHAIESKAAEQITINAEKGFQHATE